MPTDLWSFTLDFYARPGVEQACLELQASGADVCVVLCGVWLGLRGVECNAQRLSEIGQLATPWQKDVVRPLRELRTQWRAAAQDDAVLSDLRARVKALELDAEQTLLNRLEALTERWPITKRRDISAWLYGIDETRAEKNRDALHVLRIAAEVTDA
ncbi:TIGR02444 family protein [Pseudomonas viridiflava]|uniref:TIGR02444 family protein n=1 Tax=Pseudomonas viridiflava TaxID=33069 RepID=UPI0015E28E27|nr:TIGR02444 family protein [Pseudomonas viridiflava]MBA1231268.1 TIGR02444 family protein [Pseudomonas viridiflava]